MNLEQAFMQAFQELKEEGYVEQVIKEQIKKTVATVIQDCFGSWSKLSKALTKEIQENIHINLSSLDIPTYNQVVFNAIKEELERSVYNEGAKRIQEQIQQMLGTAKEEYKLSEVVDRLVEAELDLEELDFDEYREITVIVQNKWGNTFVYLDPEEGKEWYRCKYSITLDENNEVQRVSIGDTSFDNKLIMGGLYGLEKLLFQMWTRRAKLVIDEYETVFRNGED